MRLMGFSASNFMNLKAFDVRVDEYQNVIMISGKNGQGKTSALNIIIAAVGGKKLRPEKPIKDGETSGFAEVVTDKYIARVEFKLDDDGNIKEKLILQNPEGAKFTSPQKLLDSIIGDISFDPLSFINKDSKEQRETLINLAKIDFNFEKNAEERQNAYNERTIINRELRNKEGEVEGIEKPDENYLIEKKSISEILTRLENAKAKNLNNKKEKDKLNQYQEDIVSYIEEVNDLQEKLDKAKNCLLEISNASKKQEDIVLSLKDENIESILEEIKCIEETNGLVDLANNRKNAIETSTKKIEILKKNSDELTMKIEDLDNKKLSALQNAEFPLNGLSIDDKNVIYNNIPLKQVSGAEQLEIAISIAIAHNPKLPIILVKDGSLLDSYHLSIIEQMSKKHGFNVLIEKVDETEKIGIVVENGEIKKNNYL
jgi:recombinational DNA repair ATPase RecF